MGSLLEAGPLVAIGSGILLALVVWITASTFADPRRTHCLVRWTSETVSSALVPLTEFVPTIARIALGLTFAWCALIGSIATPDLHVAGATGITLRVLSVLLGTLLVVGWRTKFAATSVLLVMVVAAYAAGHPAVLLERLDVVGLATFVAIVGGRRFEPRINDEMLGSIDVAARWLRVLVAGGLVVVAVTEKLANVPMTAQVLAAHPRVDLGLLLGTSTHTTVLLLGAVEITFAVLVLLLPLPELMALMIGAPFVLSVGEFGLLEVPGHLPVWGAVACLALLGAHPQTTDLLSIRPPWLRGVTRTPAAARTHLVGGLVPWDTEGYELPHVAAAIAIPIPVDLPRTAVATTPVYRVPLGGTHTVPAAAPLAATTPPALPLPFAPSWARQTAAWLDPAAQPTAQVAPARGATAYAVNADERFQWMGAPAGAGR